MQALVRHKLRLFNSNFNSLFRISSSSYLHSSSAPLNSLASSSTATNSFTAPWSTIQRRGNRVFASDVLKVDHSQEGRGKATIKVELRDVLQGTKVTQRLGTNEDFENEMKVKVQFYDDKPISASVPKRVICTVKEVIAATPRNKKVILDNGPTIEVPPHIVAGDAILVNTEDDCYIERAKA
ncbi:hypothetical protein KIW84_053020 [Lathyrus oleraceus]|uniref:Elongation factor P C-terminal domain-containing protein n=1 Tax=Pisum sativum TaxID=3888 RepID=A0A9D5AG29_PEA|nr:hypothetical protein KIW84_053020 [Pisum sativum]